MTAEDKALEIYRKYVSAIGGVNSDKEHNKVIKYALICTTEIIWALPDKTTFDHNKIAYWNHVREEIRKLK